MAGWNDHGTYWQWDTEYPSQAQALINATKLAEQFGIFAETARVDGGFAIITRNDIPDDQHGNRCMCEKCFAF